MFSRIGRAFNKAVTGTTKEEIEAWEKVVAAMTLSEIEASTAEEARAGSCLALCCYFAQNLIGATTEMPARWAYHGTCSVICSSLSLASCRQATPFAQCAAHHWGTQIEYCWIEDLLCHNLREPRHPMYFYKQDVRLKRPPRPGRRGGGDKGGGGGDGGCCGCMCNSSDSGVACCSCDDCCDGCCGDCTDCELFLNREIRSLFCIFSCASSLHPGRCCGPAPCWENMDDRHKRWLKEAEEALDARTAAFYASYKPDDLVFKRSVSSKRLVAYQVGKGKKVRGGEPDKIAPKAQTMDRVVQEV
jgi:hypothetical protein